jgi:hypothetical protein
MAWQGQISTMVRHIINDVDPANYKYTPRRLETTILVAAHLLTTEVDLKNDYQINVEQCHLDPDPTESDTRDNDFLSLVAIKASCIILGSEVKAESGNAISIKDGPSSIDLRGVSGTLVALYKDICQKYEQMLLDYQAGNSIAGHAVLGPYSPGSDFVIRSYSDTDLRGGYFRY